VSSKQKLPASILQLQALELDWLEEVLAAFAYKLIIMINKSTNKSKNKSKNLVFCTKLTTLPTQCHFKVAKKLKCIIAQVLQR